jgi:uncharacterized membrane protein YphA (DoxX/SURF4 family)
VDAAAPSDAASLSRWRVHGHDQEFWSSEHNCDRARPRGRWRSAGLGPGTPGRSRASPRQIGDVEKLLRRLFFAFPGGLPGVALLLLRAVFGIAVMVQGGFYLGESHPTAAIRWTGLMAVAAGALLVIGFLTPIAGALLGLSALVVAISPSAGSAPFVFDSKTALIFALTILLTLIGLGPGAFSLDARVFGRREIIIPPPPSRSQR